jgi:hypothetical protein
MIEGGAIVKRGQPAAGAGDEASTRTPMRAAEQHHQTGTARAPAHDVAGPAGYELGADAEPGDSAVEDPIDEILMESFPASDPPSWTPSVAMPGPAEPRPLLA